MRTIEKTLYQFSELNDAAKERAIEWARSTWDYSWSDESLSSIKTFCNEFGVTLKNWSIGAYSSIDYSTDADNSHFRGRKIREFNRDAMPTGYCLDCDLWMTFYDVFKRTGDAKQAFENALHAGFKAWRDDMEWQLSDEALIEHIEANEFEFDEYGDLA